MAESGVVFHPDAIADARVAFLWYRDRNEQVATRFLAELDRAIAKVSQALEQCPRYYVGTHNSRFRGFPYLVVFRQREKLPTEIVAVAHAHRKPGYWKAR